jgi:hypothetical protein
MSDGIVVLGFGPQSMDFFAKAVKMCGKDAVVDPTVAHMAGANLAAGSRGALDALRARLAAGSIEAAKRETEGAGLPPGAVEWLGSGERGISSNAMFTVLTGTSAMRDERDCPDHPHDPDDFRRCELLLDAVPALRGRLALMRDVSPVWAALVDAWPEIVHTFDGECNGWRGNKDWSAPATYALMRRLIDGARAKRRTDAAGRSEEAR